MGAEIECRATIEGIEREGRASLESDFLLFRGGEYRLKIPLVPPPAVRAVDGRLELRSMVLHLGPQAAKWAEKIAHPRTLLDKLGVKSGQRVAVLGVRDADFLALLESPGKRLKQNLDFVFLGAASPADLDRLADVRRNLALAGAVWIVYPKAVKTITQADVMAATKASGLVDVKVVAFSNTHTALKAVIPKHAR